MLCKQIVNSWECFGERKWVGGGEWGWERDRRECGGREIEGPDRLRERQTEAGQRQRETRERGRKAYGWTDGETDRQTNHRIRIWKPFYSRIVEREGGGGGGGDRQRQTEGRRDRQRDEETDRQRLTQESKSSATNQSNTISDGTSVAHSNRSNCKAKSFTMGRQIRFPMPGPARAGRSDATHLIVHAIFCVFRVHLTIWSSMSSSVSIDSSHLLCALLFFFFVIFPPISISSAYLIFHTAFCSLFFLYPGTHLLSTLALSTHLIFHAFFQ